MILNLCARAYVCVMVLMKYDGPFEVKLCSGMKSHIL